METGLWDTQERFTAERVLRRAAELALHVVPVETSAHAMKTPFSSGRLLMHEVQPGLVVTASDMTHFKNPSTLLESDPALCCSVLLAGRPDRMRIDRHDYVSKCLERPVLIGYGRRVRVERPEIEAPYRSCDAGFMLKPEFFDRFGEDVTDDGLCLLREFARADYRATTLARSPRLLGIAGSILACPYNGDLGRLFLESSALALVVEVAALIGQERTRVPGMAKRRYDQIALARAILDARMASPPSTLELARQVGVNVTTLQAEFKRVYGTTLFGHVREQRLLMARVLLQESGQGAAEIGRRVGFSSPAAFATAYRRRFGHPPMTARRGLPPAQ